ncbi:hypothetical protein RHECNPAF_122100173 [Rhizobium etli CNPAF512]|nr:hypothetical protein RHECNPAF_122100173 [Rhizobium etli CNPAF512]
MDISSWVGLTAVAKSSTSARSDPNRMRKSVGTGDTFRRHSRAGCANGARYRGSANLIDSSPSAATTGTAFM